MASHTVSATKREGGRVDGGLKLRWIEDVESDRQMTGRREETGKQKSLLRLFTP